MSTPLQRLTRRRNWALVQLKGFIGNLTRLALDKDLFTEKEQLELRSISRHLQDFHDSWAPIWPQIKARNKETITP